MLFKQQLTTYWAYLAGFIDRKGRLFIHDRLPKIAVKWHFSFMEREKAITFWHLMVEGQNLVPHILHVSDGPRTNYFPSFTVEQLDKVMPYLHPYSLKEDISFYLEARRLSRKKRGEKIPTELIQKRENLLTRWEIYKTNR